MQQPDADGFVTITWPSKSIPHGGIFHPRVVEPTEKQREFLKILLQESKMAIEQRKKEYLLRREEEKQVEPEPQTPRVRPRTSKRRSLSAIRASGIYNEEPILLLKRGQDREKLKDKLANTMAYGTDVEPPRAPTMPKSKPKLPTPKEIWNDLVTQIRERAEWLAEMEDLGQGEQHRAFIEEQIAERLRAMNALGIDNDSLSIKSGFSTIRSKEIPTNRSKASVHSTGSRKSVNSRISVRAGESATALPEIRRSPQGSGRVSGRSVRKEDNEENVASYIKISPLKYSPRRRV